LEAFKMSGPNKRKANIRKREKQKIAKEKRDLHKQIMKLVDIDKITPESMKPIMRLKLTRLLEKYKSEYGEIK
tara:strand:- start:19591 stop:19809 length:219 start_codon:yes stop_codon:yes gene_type:complete